MPGFGGQGARGVHVKTVGTLMVIHRCLNRDLPQGYGGVANSGLVARGAQAAHVAHAHVVFTVRVASADIAKSNKAVIDHRVLKRPGHSGGSSVVVLKHFGGDSGTTALPETTAPVMRHDPSCYSHRRAGAVLRHGQRGGSRRATPRLPPVHQLGPQSRRLSANPRSAHHVRHVKFSRV